jgi:3-deoxy-D-manno-octulosonic-acid transferase
MDHAGWVERFFAHWRPDVACWVESEFWPLLCLGAERRGIPRLLLNGRISAQSFRLYSWLPRLSRVLIGGFAALRVQDNHQLGYFHTLGAEHARVGLNLKNAAQPLPFDSDVLAAWQQAVEGRELWVAASTHEGEEAIVGQAHKILKQHFPHALCLLIPRHRERTETIAKMLRDDHGLQISVGVQPDCGESDVHIVDQFGVLGLFYRLSAIAFVGGSLVPIGGHNLREAALLCCALISGSYTHNFRQQYERFSAVLQSVETAQDLASSVQYYWLNKDFLEKSRSEAYFIARAESAEALEANFSVLVPFLQQDNRNEQG